MLTCSMKNIYISWAGWLGASICRKSSASVQRSRNPTVNCDFYVIFMYIKVVVDRLLLCELKSYLGISFYRGISFYSGIPL
jgi:hypothetical protein